MKANTIPTEPKQHNLCNPGVYTINAFVQGIVEAATRDFEAGRTQMRTGRDLCNHFCAEWRKGHERMAASLYRQTHWTLTAAKNERDTGVKKVG